MEATDAARLDIAFRWLKEGRPVRQPFKSHHGCCRAGTRSCAAEFTASTPRRHPGASRWATFLKWRETGTGDPRSVVQKQALEFDPRKRVHKRDARSLAHLAGRTAGRGAPVLDAAVAAGKDRDTVRTFQLAALRNRNDEAADAELIRVAELDAPAERASRRTFRSRRLRRVPRTLRRERAVVEPSGYRHSDRGPTRHVRVAGPDSWRVRSRRGRRWCGEEIERVDAPALGQTGPRINAARKMLSPPCCRQPTPRP